MEPTAARPTLLAGYRTAVDYLDRELVRLTPRAHDPAGKVRAARAFNRALGDPQRAGPAIQIAGTSGKGTVAHFIAAALSAAGLRTGCHLSPYLQAFTEKSWIDGRYCSVETLVAAVDEVRPVAAEFAADDACPASVHGMASLAVSYLAFRDARLDVAVIETGLGGRFDLVQGLERELSVITELGLDHTAALGPTLEEIAWHKAGIMAAGVPCVAARGAAWGVLEAEARRVGAPLDAVDLASARALRDGRLTLRLDSIGELEVELGSVAPFVARNAALAGAALDRLARAGWPIAAEHVRAGLGARLPGRLEIVQESPRVILDCAHNPQKVAALAEAVNETGLTVVFAATGSRVPEELLKQIAPRTSRLIATGLELYGKTTVDAAEIAATGARLGLDSTAIPLPEAALEAALATTPPGTSVLVTGSIYLVGRLRHRWYPTDEVVVQRTSWPASGRDQAPPLDRPATL